MPSICDNLNNIRNQLKPYNATLVAVSKTKPAALIQEAAQCDQIDFGENYVQELTEKHGQLSDKLKWHMIGHLQSNKVKYIAPFVSLIHTVDSLKLLAEINKQGLKHNRVIDVLIQIYIASEDTKSGLSYNEADLLFASVELKSFQNVRIKGLMGMATFTENEKQIASEFRSLKIYFDNLKSSFPKFDTLSMGMSSDYKVALNEGSNMVRIGSLIFGNR